MLTASHLTRRFGPRLAVDDVSLALPAGEVFALLGPNGAGKTTTLRMLAGLIAPSSGTVRVEGEARPPVASATARARIGLLTEHPGLWDRLSVADNLLVYARLHGLADPRGAVAGALARFDLAGRGDELAAALSKGLRQRVALARTLLHDPRVVLLDEPTSGLDPASARDVRNLIARLRGEGRAVLISTHNLDEAERLADRVAVLRTRLLAVDTPEALRARLLGHHLRVRLGQDAAPFVPALAAAGARVEADGAVLRVTDGLDAPAVVRRLVEAGADVHEVTRTAAGLEEVYLRLVEEGDA